MIYGVFLIEIEVVKSAGHESVFEKRGPCTAKVLQHSHDLTKGQSILAQPHQKRMMINANYEYLEKILFITNNLGLLEILFSIQLSELVSLDCPGRWLGWAGLLDLYLFFVSMLYL